MDNTLSFPVRPEKLTSGSFSMNKQSVILDQLLCNAVPRDDHEFVSHVISVTLKRQ